MSATALAWKGEPQPERSSGLDEALRSAQGAKLSWVHSTIVDAEAARPVLAERFGLHELEVSDVLDPTERPHLHEREGVLFFSAPWPYFEGDSPRFREVSFLLTPKMVATFSCGECGTLESLQSKMAHGRLEVRKGSAFLMHELLDAVVDDWFPFLDRFEDLIDDMEARIFSSRGTHVQELLGLKYDVLVMRRQLGPLRDVVNSMLRRGVEGLPTESAPFFQDVYDHVLRLLESVELNRELISTLLEAHVAVVGNRTNDTMRVLTMISTVMMTMALVAGVYGMNFAHMPELNQPWGYPMALGIMALLAGAEIALFRKMGWL